MLDLSFFVWQISGIVNTQLANIHGYILDFFKHTNLNLKEWYHGITKGMVSLEIFPMDTTCLVRSIWCSLAGKSYLTSNMLVSIGSAECRSDR
jgi:hypothetical protein